MALVKITTPVDEQTIRGLNVGDTVSITGRLYTGRDAVHHRIHEGTKPPVDLNGAILYHCGPVMVKEGDQWICKAAGPTTSSREEPDMQACYRLGANSYVVKPVAFEDFATAVAGVGFYWMLLNQPLS